MTYNDDFTWSDLSKIAGQQAADMTTQLTSGLVSYNEWQSFRAGRTNAAIATVLGKTETNIAEMDACFGAIKELYDAANNVAISQSDRFYSMRKFS